MSSVGTRIWNLISSLVIDLPWVKLKACSTSASQFMGTCLTEWWIVDLMYESEVDHFNFLLLPVLKWWNVAMNAPQSTLLLYLFIHSVNRVECLLDAGHHKRIFTYKNDLKEPLIGWGRLCSKEITFRFSLMEFIDWMNNPRDYPQISLNLHSFPVYSHPVPGL